MVCRILMSLLISFTVCFSVCASELDSRTQEKENLETVLQADLSASLNQYMTANHSFSSFAAYEYANEYGRFKKAKNIATVGGAAIAVGSLGMLIGTGLAFASDDDVEKWGFPTTQQVWGFITLGSSFVITSGGIIACVIGYRKKKRSQTKLQNIYPHILEEDKKKLEFEGMGINWNQTTTALTASFNF